MTNIRKLARILFPQASGINVNMMPFVMGDLSSVPEELRGYAPLIEACDLPESELGKIGYLTIDERYVGKGTHRRAGLHTEGFGDTSWGGGGGWGGRVGGLYMANSVPNSCALYDMAVEASGAGGEIPYEIVDDVPEVLADPDTIYWIHDRVPHESLPVEDVMRQFFRLVTSEVSVWFADHSTANRLGVEPTAKKIFGNKFKK